jgi:hypothetical protein
MLLDILVKGRTSMNKNFYQVPIVTENPSTAVLVQGYEINNPTAFTEKNGDGHLTIHLTFKSNDYSPDKYTKFISALNDFLNTYSGS